MNKSRRTMLGAGIAALVAGVSPMVSAGDRCRRGYSRAEIRAIVSHVLNRNEIVITIKGPPEVGDICNVLTIESGECQEVAEVIQTWNPDSYVDTIMRGFD